MPLKKIPSSDSKTKENLIIFIDGFIGGDETWIRKDDQKSILDHLKEDEIIASEFDFAVFDYYTQLTDKFDKIKGAVKMIAGKGIVPKNIGISDIAQILKSEINYLDEKYNKIILIGHSMGGLIAKSLIVEEIKELAKSSYSLFISLAVPHKGSDLAIWAKTILSSPQIEDLQPLSEIVNQLTYEWLKYPIELPVTVYFQAKYDTMVPPTSSIGFDMREPNVVYTAHDHFSIVKPPADDLVMVAIKANLRECLINKSDTTSNVLSDEDESRFEQTNDLLKRIEKLTPYLEQFFSIALQNPDTKTAELYKTLSTQLSKGNVAEVIKQLSDEHISSEIQSIKVEEIKNKKKKEQLADALILKGLALLTSNEINLAEQAYIQATEISHDTVTFDRLAHFYDYIDELTKEKTALFESLELSDSSRSKSVSLHSIGNYFLKINNPIEAENAFKEALKIKQNLAEKDPRHSQSLIITLNNLGLLYSTNNKIYNKELQEIFKSAILLINNNSTYIKDKNILPGLLTNHAFNLIRSDNFEDAEEAINEAIEIRQTLLLNNNSLYHQKGMSLSYSCYSTLKQAQSVFDQAETYAKNALLIAKNLVLHDVREYFNLYYHMVKQTANIYTINNNKNSFDKLVDELKVNVEMYNNVNPSKFASISARILIEFSLTNAFLFEDDTKPKNLFELACKLAKPYILDPETHHYFSYASEILSTFRPPEN